ncbi:MAG TPA: PrkA family serine protein kinase, partial [Psychromonas sp.]
MSLLEHYRERYENIKEEEMSIQAFLDLCKEDPAVYASAAERILMAIGEPELIDTARDTRLSRIFSNKVIKRYAPFKDFYGMEECIENIVSFFK